jgi:hypothetical protein
MLYASLTAQLTTFGLTSGKGPKGGILEVIRVRLSAPVLTGCWDRSTHIASCSYSCKKKLSHRERYVVDITTCW